MVLTPSIVLEASVFTLGVVTIHALREHAEAVTGCLVAVAVGIAMLALLGLTGLRAEHNPPPIDDPAAFGSE